MCYTKTIDDQCLQYSNVQQRDTTKITITGSATEVCTGTNLTFLANAAQGGDTPQYQWLVNDIEKQKSGLNTFTVNILNNNDKVKCVLISSKKCVTNSALPSNEIAAKIKSTTTTGITLAVNKEVTCSNEKVIFTASPTGAGTQPQYQWFVNTTPVGVNWFTYESTDLKNNDIVKVRMTSSETCVTQSTVESNAIKMTVNMCTGLDDLNSDKIAIYPNPTLTGNFTLDMKDIRNIKSIELFNSIGQLIFYKKIENIDNQRLISLDLGENTEGVYLLRLSGDGFQIQKKILKI